MIDVELEQHWPIITVTAESTAVVNCKQNIVSVILILIISMRCESFREKENTVVLMN